MTKIEDFNRRVIFDGGARLLYSPEINSEGKERIEQIAEFLSNNPEYSFSLYFNHISLNDPWTILYVTELIDRKHTRHLVAPVSFSHTDPSNPKSKATSFIVDAVKICGVETIPVIQTYQIDNDAYNYTAEEARQTHMKFMYRMKELKTSGTTVGFLINPEGHRSETKEMLGRVESGVIAAGRMMAPIIYIPVGISYLGKYNRESINIGRKMRVGIGEVVVQENPKDYPDLKDLMHKLAQTLPEDMRGPWK